MDLIEIDYHDYLAECTSSIGEDITCWFTDDRWKNDMLSYFKNKKYEEDKTISIDDIQFRVGDDLIFLSEGVYEKEPHTVISSYFEGRLATLAMIARIFIKDGKLKGKMRIYNASRHLIKTSYEFSLHSAEMIQTVGLKICGDGWGIDNFKFKFVQSDLSFKYIDNLKEISLFDREMDIHKRKLLQQYMLEYITKDLGPATADYMWNQLNIKALVSNSVGADYSLKNLLSIHNKKMRKAFKNLSEKIISIANSLLVKRSPKLQCPEFYSLVKIKNEEHNLKVHSGFIDQFDSLAFLQDKNAIISNKDDLVIVHVPVDFENLKLHITEHLDGSSFNHKEQTYKTSGCNFIMSLKRLSEDEVKINLIDFKVLNITPTSEISVNVVMDHLITYAIEQHVKQFLEEAMMYKELQELAIKPDVDIEYDCDDDLMAEDSEFEE